MKILLTNDDGIGAAGLDTLNHELAQDHDVRIVAPDRERSGVSHATTFREEVIVRDLGDNQFSCSGTPADCVLYSLLGALDFAPDVVVSGINHGANLGTDIIFSGTVAGARQAAMMKVPGIAVSLVTRNAVPDFSVAARFIRKHLAYLHSLWDEEHFINVNIPDEAAEGAVVVVTKPARRIYDFRIVAGSSTPSEKGYLLRGTVNCAPEDGETDWTAVKSGTISISPVCLYPVNHADKEPQYADRVAAFTSGTNEVEFKKSVRPLK